MKSCKTKENKKQVKVMGYHAFVQSEAGIHLGYKVIWNSKQEKNNHRTGMNSIMYECKAHVSV